MCGIAYCKSFNKRQANKRIRKIYGKQRSRGHDGFGFITVNKNNVKLFRSIHEHDILFKLKHTPSKEIMFHHRFPTSTDNHVKSNHPIYNIRDYDHNYYLVHNGVIQNDDELKKDHEGMGLHYETSIGDKFNDSETLLHELALVIEGIKDKKDFKARGSMAFIMLQTDKTGRAKKLFYGRNFGSPLKISFEKNKCLVLSSQGPGHEVDTHELCKFDYATQMISEEYMTFPSGYYNDSGKGFGQSHTHLSGWDDDDYGVSNLPTKYTTPLLPAKQGSIVQELVDEFEMSGDDDRKDSLIVMSYEKVLHNALRKEVDEIDFQCLTIEDNGRLMTRLQNERARLRKEKEVALVNNDKNRAAVLDVGISNMDKNIGKIINVMTIFSRNA